MGWKSISRGERGSEEPVIDEKMREGRGRFSRSVSAWKSYFSKAAGEMGFRWVRHPYAGIAAAFLIPVLVMVIIFIQRGIFPFGEKSFLRTDMYHQYAPFFSEFRYKLKNGRSLLYSWDIGMGVNFPALFAYYLASPLNWLILLCPGDYVIEFMTYMIVIKTGLCGASMAWYLREHDRRHGFAAAFFGIFYALSGYLAAYNWNIMWLDCIILFPLVMLGAERLAHEGKGTLYCISLGLSILSNYYISIMTCFFMVIYFAMLLALDQECTWREMLVRMVQFAAYSLLSGMLAAVVLLPEVYALKMTASASVNFPKTYTQYFSIFDMLARHICNVDTEIGLGHWPNIYCGVAVLMFFVLYLLEEKIPLMEKAAYCLMFLFFMASFSINLLNFIWHGFHYPNSLPCRQSYIYIFLMLFVCFRAYTFLEEMPRRRVLGAFWGAVIFVLLAQKLVTEEDFHFSVYYAAILFLTLYLGLILLVKKDGRYRSLAGAAALLIVSVEAAVNLTTTSITTTSRDAYVKDNAAVERLVGSVMSDSSFFRFEKITRKTKNDGAWMHFPSVSIFSSTANADLSSFFKKIGCESSTNSYSITGSTPLVDMLFDIKYGLYSEQPPDEEFRTYVAEDEGVYLYENRYALPLGFVVDDGFEERFNLELEHPADVQNSLAAAVGSPQVLELASEATADGKEMRFIPSRSGEYYAYVGNQKIEQVKVTAGDNSKTFKNLNRGYFIELGFCMEGQEIVLAAQDTEENMWADIYRASGEGISSVHEKLMACPFEVSGWTDTSVTGTVDSAEGGRLLLSIPYDTGWTATVDGAEQKPARIFKAFMGLTLTPGKHTVELHYFPKGLKPGAMLSVAGLILLAVFADGGRASARRLEAWKKRHRA